MKTNQLNTGWILKLRHHRSTGSSGPSNQINDRDGQEHWSEIKKRNMYSDCWNFNKVELGCTKLNIFKARIFCMAHLIISQIRYCTHWFLHSSASTQTTVRGRVDFNSNSSNTPHAGHPSIEVLLTHKSLSLVKQNLFTVLIISKN